MREIKFRAFDKRDKTIKDVVSIHWLYKKVMFFDGNIFYDTGLSDVEILQYTGLKDSTGKEIYEGDIVEFKMFAIHLPKRIQIGEIIYSKVYPMFIINSYYGKWGESDFFGTRFEECGKIEVIGNIYENPELME